MSRVGSGDVAIQPTFVGFRSQVSQEVDGAGSESGNRFTQAFGNGVKGIGSLVGKSLLAAGAITTAVAAIAIKGGISRQLQIEDATAKLDGLGNSTENVKTIMDNALASVKGTAFGMGEAATVAAGATAAGIKPGQALERILKLTGDSATIAGTSMGEMGSIFNKVASTGKLTGDVVAQLQDRGFPILQMVADKYGVTAEAASKMVSKGQVDFATFADAIETNVGGAALKSGNTTKGAFANMNAALSRTGVVLSGGFFPLVKDVFNQVTTILDGVTAKVKPTAEAFGVWFQGKAGPAIAGFSTVALAGFDRVYDGAARLASGLSMNTIARIESGGQLEGLVAFGAGLRSVFDETVGSYRAFVAAWKANDGDITSSGVAGFFENLGFRMHQVWDSLQPLFGSFSDGWSQLRVAMSTGDFSSVGDDAGRIFGAIGSILGPLGPVLIAVGSNMGTIGTKIGEVIAGGLPLLAPLLDVAAGALGFLADHTELLTPLVIGIAAAFIAYRFSQGLANVAALASIPLQATRSAALIAGAIATNNLARSNAALAAANITVTTTERDGLIARLPATAAWIAQTAAKVGNTIATGAQAAVTGTATAAQWLFNAAMSANPLGLIVIGIVALIAVVVLLVANWGTVVSFFKGVWDGIVSGVKWFIGFAIDLFLKFHPVGLIISHWGEIVIFFKGVWDGIVSGIKWFIGFAVDLFLKFHPVGLIISHWGEIGGFFAGLWSNITGGISGFVSGVVGFFTGLPGQILSVLAGAGLWLLQTGTDILNGLGSGISAGWTAVSTFFTNLPLAIALFMVSAGIWLLQTGTNVLNGLGNGIASGWVAVTGFFLGLPSQILGFLSSAGVWLVVTGTNVVTGLRNGITNTWSGLMGWFGSIPGMVMGAVSGAGSWLVDTGKNIIDGLLSGLKNAGSAIGSFFLGLLPGWIVGPFKAALGIHSPSTVFAGFGENIGQGVVVGAKRTRSDIERAMSNLVTVPAVDSRAIAAASTQRLLGTGGSSADGGQFGSGTIIHGPLVEVKPSEQVSGPQVATLVVDELMWRGVRL